MPIHTGRDSKGPYYQWGHQAKYHYKPNNPISRAKALKKAKLQERVIIASGYKKK